MATKKKTKKAPAASSWTTEAGLQALLKYGPQLSALDSLYSDAQSEYQRQSNNARFLQQQAAGAIDHAQTDNQTYTDRALARQKEIGGGTLDPVAATALNNSSADFARQLADDRTSNVKRGAFQTQQASDQLAATIGKLLQQRQQIASESGDFTSLTSMQLKEAADKIANDNKQKDLDRTGRLDTALIGQGLDPETLKPLPGAKSNKPAKVLHNRSATGAPLQSAEKHDAARAGASQAWTYLHEANVAGKLHGRSDAELAKLLSTPTTSTSTSVKDQKTGVTTSHNTPASKGVDPLIARATVEQFRHKHISQATVDALADAGYSIKRLRFVTPRQFAKRQAKKPGSTVTGLAGALGRLGTFPTTAG